LDPRPLSHHRAAPALSDQHSEPAGLPRDRRDPRVHRLGGPRAHHPRHGALDPARRIRGRRRGAGHEPTSHHPAAHPSQPAILPTTIAFVIVAATISIPGYILGEIVLSFLGVGVQEPSASWGNMLNQARGIRILESFPWLVYVPGTAIFLTVMAFNLLGDGLR